MTELEQGLSKTPEEMSQQDWASWKVIRNVLDLEIGRLQELGGMPIEEQVKRVWARNKGLEEESTGNLR